MRTSWATSARPDSTQGRPTDRERREHWMSDEKQTRTGISGPGMTALAALGVVTAYFAVVVALMYPVAQAAGYLT